MKNLLLKKSTDRLRAIGEDLIRSASFGIPPDDLKFLVKVTTKRERWRTEAPQLFLDAANILKMLAIVNQRHRIDILSNLLPVLRKEDGSGRNLTTVSLFFDILYIDQTKRFQEGCSYGKSKFDTNARGQYYYIPSTLHNMVRLPQPFIEKEGRFIDVGSGIGDKVFLHYALYDCASDGVEYDFYTHAIADNLLETVLQHTHPWRTWLEKRLDRKPIRFFQEDAFNFDFQQYSKIYMFCPLSDGKKLGKLYQHIVDTIKPGALIFEVFFDQLERDVRDRLVKGLKVRGRTSNNCYFERI